MLGAVDLHRGTTNSLLVNIYKKTTTKYKSLTYEEVEAAYWNLT